MEFSSAQPIYLQIADLVCEKILLGAWPAGQRVPSIRELAVQLGVNPNTVLRTYDLLQEEALFINRRGIGIFAADDAMAQAARFRKALFFEQDLPQFFRTLYMLEIDLEELKARYEQYRKQMKKQRDQKTTR
jgi:DNA-binding transcriptional regulator YhcF (GntR family)